MADEKKTDEEKDDGVSVWDILIKGGKILGGAVVGMAGVIEAIKEGKDLLSNNDDDK